MYDLPLELYQIILEQLKFRSQIRIRLLSRKLYKLEIYDFYNIPQKYIKRLSDKILKLYPFIKKLNVCDNYKVTNVNHMTNLKILGALGDCGIDDNGIKDLNLIELDAGYNPRIKNINHMTNLRKLDASGICGIDYE